MHIYIDEYYFHVKYYKAPILLIYLDSICQEHKTYYCALALNNAFEGFNTISKQ